MDMPKQFHDAGARRTSERAPDLITLEWLRVECDRLERVLRLQYPEGKLDEVAEASLARYKPAANTTRALRLWAQLKHLYLSRSERRTAPRSTEPTTALDQLMRRTPVVTSICGRRVEVTGRSYSALTELAAHSVRRDLLTEDAARLAELAVELRAALRGRIRGRGRLRRRLRHVEALHRRTLTEREHHRRAIYAHALTPHGGPARDNAAEAPAWWREIGPVDESLLLRALHEAGPGRYHELGEPPRPQRGREASRQPTEDFGLATLLAAWGVRLKVRPAGLYDVDLGQLLAEMRAANPAVAGAELEEAIGG